VTTTTVTNRRCFSMVEGLMAQVKVIFIRLILVGAVICCLAAPTLQAQDADESPAVTKYRDDYEAYQRIMAAPDAVKRGEQLIAFISKGPSPKLLPTAQASLFQIMDGLIKSENNEPLLALSEKYIKVKPKVGETYYCYGIALKNLKRFEPAMDSLAKCYLIKNPLSTKAKDFLDFVYKGQHRGSLAGEEQVIGKARAEVVSLQ
jgi:tetratricopeptide (TPR) repeat protein